MNATKRVLTQKAKRRENFFIIVWELMRNDAHEACIRSFSTDFHNFLKQVQKGLLIL